MIRTIAFVFALIVGGVHKFLTFTSEMLERGMAIIGSTGTGKSRLLLQIIMEHLRLGRGLALVDPGDLVDDVLAKFARLVIHSGKKDVLKKVHLIELSPFQLARFDAFRFYDDRGWSPEIMETVYKAWQHTKVQEVAEAYQRKQGHANFEGMPRAQRLFINVFTAVSTLIGDRRLSIADANLLVDIGNTQHRQVFDRLREKLPREIVADFEVLHGFKTLRDLRQETESFINRIRSMHGPLLKEMLATTGFDPTFDIRQAIERGHIVLIKVAKTPYASTDQNYALAAIFINALIDVIYSVTRKSRTPFTLMVDEFHKFKQLSLVDVVRTCRKYRLALILASTDLSSLRTPEHDYAAELLSVINTVIAFRMTWPADIQIMADILFAKNLKFEDLIHEIERRDGVNWIPVDEWSESVTRQTSSSQSSSSSNTSGTSRESSRGQSAAKSVNRHDFVNGQSTTNKSNSRSTGDSVGSSHSAGFSEGESHSETESRGVTINHKLVHIDNIVRELQRTGRLVEAVNDQRARFAQQIATLPHRHAYVRIGDSEAIEIETLDAPDAFVIPQAYFRAIDWIRQELHIIHDYYFTPRLDPQLEARRIDAFLNGCADHRESHNTDVPRIENSPPSPLL